MYNRVTIKGAKGFEAKIIARTIILLVCNKSLFLLNEKNCNFIYTKQSPKLYQMAAVKTKPTEQTIKSFLDKVPDEKARNDCYTLIRIMEKVTGEKPKMWGPAIIGFGQYHYKYDSGREGDICLTGFSPRKGSLSLYVLAGFKGQEELLAKLGKHKIGKGCLYIKKLDDVDINVLERLIIRSFEFLKKKHAG
jgi:hypothetical protein